MNKQKKTKLKLFFKEAVWTFILVLVLELFEEILEEAIAVGFTWLIQKTISAIFVVTITQTIKVAIKRLIKFITYKEGNDKMNFLKKYFTLMWGNKITGTSAGILGAGLVYFQTLVPQLTGVWYYALAGFIIFYNLAAILGGETLTQILDRIMESTLKKTEIKKIKEAKEKALEIAKQIDEKYQELATAKSKELEEQLRAEAENIVLNTNETTAVTIASKAEGV